MRHQCPLPFEKLDGESIDAALLQQVVVGAVNLLFTVMAIWTVDKLGRKPLMLIGSAGMGIALVIFVKCIVPETKGKTLEEIEKMWIKN